MVHINPVSIHLTDDQNRLLLDEVLRSHKKNQIVSIAVVKLYLTDNSEDHRVWHEKCTGTVTFTKDYARKSYFIQIFEMQSYQRVWEQELYNEIVYKSPTPQGWFHTFEADKSMAGLSFLDEKEAKTFLEAVQTKIAQKREKLQSQRQQQRHTPAPVKQIPAATTKLGPTVNLKPNKNDTLKGKKKKLSKADISGPSSFVHVSGVQRAQHGGMEMVDNSHLVHDPVIKRLLMVSGIDPKSLGVSELKQVEQHARDNNLYQVYDKKKRESIKGKPAKPVRAKPQNHLAPIREDNLSPQKPPIPDRNNSPSIPPRNRQPPPAVLGRRQNPTPPPPPPVGGGGPPPPPPPPPPGPTPPPPPPVNKDAPPALSSSNKPSPGGGGGGGDFLAGIQNFNKNNLKNAPSVTEKPKPNKSAGGFLAEIENFKSGNLKKVEVEDKPAVKAPPAEGLMGSLLGQLDIIKFANGNFDSSDEDGDDDGNSSSDEWDDDD